MSGDPLKHVQSGDPLAIRAETFNCLIDAARDFKQRTRHLGRTPSPSFPNPTVVPVRNDTGSDQPRFAVLGLDGPIIDPADNASEFASRAAATGVIPMWSEEHAGRWCVLAEPVPAGAIGRAYVAGLFPGKVWVENGDAAELDRCEIRNGYTQLEMTHNGSARVVWKEFGTGLLWALLLPDGGPPPKLWSVTLLDTVEEKQWDFAVSGEATLDETGETIDVVAGDQFTGVAFEGNKAWAVPPEPGGVLWHLVDGGTTFIVASAGEAILHGEDGPATISGSPGIGITVKASLHGCSEGDLLYCWWDSPGGGHWDFLRNNKPPSAGCGLTLEDDEFSVVPADLIGFGLRESDDTEDCELEVDPDALAGCGLTTLGPGTPLDVDPESLAGFGLDPGQGTCDLDVDTSALAGCGLTTGGAGTPLDLDAASVAGFGLVAIAPCVLAVDSTQLAGCGLIGNIVTGRLDVDPVTLAGPGLLSFGLCGLQVDVGCGLAIVGDQVVFDPTFVAGVNSGLDTDGPCGLKVRTGCGIKIEFGSVAFDADAVAGGALIADAGCILSVNAGDGLEIVADTLIVKAGCSIAINAEDGSVEVDVATLAGDGLIASPGTTCDELAVQPGCGLEIAPNKSVQIRRIEVMGAGLKAGDGSPCELEVDWDEFPGGCGLALNDGYWDVDNETLAGEGLVAGIGCSLAVNTGCGLTVNAGFVEFDATSVAGEGLLPGIGCSIDVNPGCGITIDEGAVAVDVAALASSDIEPAGGGCNLRTVGFTGVRPVVTAIECDPYDPYACPVAVIEDWHFENGLLKSVV